MKLANSIRFLLIMVLTSVSNNVHSNIIPERKLETIVSIDGTLISYQISGSGPPLVLIHGGTADHTRWNSIVPDLEQKFTVYAVDRRGRGNSSDNDEYSIEREFEDVAEVANAIGKPVYLLGHSFGAFCSLEASLLTGNIEKLILYEPPPPGIKGTIPPKVGDKMQKLLKAGDREGVLSTFFLEVALVPPNELEMLKSLPAWQGRIAAAHTIFREIKSLEEHPPFDPDRFKTMTTNTLLLLGGDSPSEYSDFIRQLDEALPNSRVEIMPGQQHVAMNTAPAMFVAAVVKFLSNNH